jgi:hypothetical protein
MTKNKIEFLKTVAERKRYSPIKSKKSAY